MKNFKNSLNLIDNISEQCFEWIRSEVNGNGFRFELAADLFSLPCLKYETGHKMSMVVSLLEDGVVNDTVITWLVELLDDIPEELLLNYEARITSCIQFNYLKLTRRQLLLLANAFEVMYAKGYEVLDLLIMVYQRIPLNDGEFNPDSDENVRIKLAKIAYSTTRFNFHDNISTVKYLKCHLKKSDRKYLMGTLYYYKSLCLRAANWKGDYKDATYFMLKSRERGFKLAAVYLEHASNNFETSKNAKTQDKCAV